MVLGQACFGHGASKTSGENSRPQTLCAQTRSEECSFSAKIVLFLQLLPLNHCGLLWNFVVPILYHCAISNCIAYKAAALYAFYNYFNDENHVSFTRLDLF